MIIAGEKLWELFQILSTQATDGFSQAARMDSGDMNQRGVRTSSRDTPARLCRVFRKPSSRPKPFNLHGLGGFQSYPIARICWLRSSECFACSADNRASLPISTNDSGPIDKITTAESRVFRPLGVLPGPAATRTGWHGNCNLNAPHTGVSIIMSKTERLHEVFSC